MLHEEKIALYEKMPEEKMIKQSKHLQEHRKQQGELRIISRISSI